MAAPTHREPSNPKVDDPDDIIGWSMLVVVVLGGLCALFVPFKDYATVLCLAAIVTTVVLIAKDAREKGQSPGLWVLGAVLLFPVAFVAYMHFRRRLGAPWRLAHALLAVTACVAGAVALFVPWASEGRTALHLKLWGPAARVTVSCRAKGEMAQEGYLCAPRHVGGYQSARACWDLALTCENGTNLVEHVCSQVVLGEVRESYVPFEYSPGVDDCDKLASASVNDLRVEVDPR